MTDELNKGADGLDQGDPAAVLAHLRRLAHVANGPVGMDPDEADAQYLNKAARRVEAGALGHGSTVTATVAGLLRGIIPALVRASGAAAAAPPGDEEAATAWPQDGALVVSANGRHRGTVDYVVDQGNGRRIAWVRYGDGTGRPISTDVSDLRPAPPAGHEDEAAVERAARDEVENRHHIHGEWCLCGFRSAVARDRTVHILDALAAARGPRTPDPEL